MNIYDALNLAEMNGHRASLQSDGRWFLIRKSDRAIVNIGYSIIEAVSVLVEAEAEVVETVEVVADAATTEAEAEVVETANLSNYDIVTMAEVNGFRVSLQANGEWLLIRKEDRMTVNIGYNLRDAVAIINPTPETMSQVEIERGYAAQEAEEHAAWVESQKTEEVVDVLDEIDESGDHGYSVPEEREDEELSFIEAAELLHQASRGRVSDEMIEQARSVVVNALSIDLEARGVTFHQDSLQDWVACTNFSGRELIGSLADEWIDEHNITAPNWSAAANEYDAWLKQNYV